MMKGYSNWFSSIVVILFAVVLVGAIDQMTKDALKVKDILRKIEKHPHKENSKEQIAEVSEKELNSYIAYELAQDKDNPVNSLIVDLLEKNHIQGKIALNAQKLNLGIVFGDDLGFDFNGFVHSRDGKARFELTALQLNGKPVKPQLLDYVIKAAELYYGTELGRVDDWYEMPEGIKRVAVTNGKAILYY
jgi:hypothetical protein